jgi:hypothetical protein
MITGIAFLVVIVFFMYVFIKQWIGETKEAKEFNAQDNFQMYREKYPNKVLEDGTVICKHCGSHKTVMHYSIKYCQTCNAFLYRTYEKKGFWIGL